MSLNCFFLARMTNFAAENCLIGYVGDSPGDSHIEAGHCYDNIQPKYVCEYELQQDSGKGTTQNSDKAQQT